MVIGAGLAGLACARTLSSASREVLVLEAGDAVGGRIRTDEVVTSDGTYLVDRGFQVLLTAYPEARRMLDYEALDLRCFYAGADVRLAGRTHRVANPWRHPLVAAKAFGSPIATLGDKTRLAELYGVNRLTSLDSMFAKPEVQTITMLRYLGFADTTIDRFFRPFFGGVFFDRELLTSSRMFEFVFRMFSTGDTAVPARGMQRMPEQLAAGLPAGSIRLGTRVLGIEPAGSGVRVALPGGKTVEADRVVVATEGDSAARLLGGLAPERVLNTDWVGTTTLAYGMDQADRPTPDPILTLDGDGTGPVNHLVVASNVAPAYAPSGRSLVYANSVGVPSLDDASLDAAARAQLRGWFGERVDRWRLITAVRVARALPDQRVRDASERVPAACQAGRVAPGVYLCGDHTCNASIDGALKSGRLVGEAILSGA